MTTSSCPLCGRDDAIGAKDEPRFYVDGRLTACCFHGHEGRGPVVFDAETGSLIRSVELTPHELLYRAAEAEGARGMGAQFLAKYCGIYALSRESIRRANPPFPTEKDWIRALKEEGVLTVAPLYRGARMTGLEVRIVESASIGRTSKWTRVLGERGVYIARPEIQAEAVVVLEGTWDAVAASWDSFENQTAERYAFVSVSASMSPDVVAETLRIHWPGVPVVVLTDQDAAGKRARAKFARLGTLACLPGAGLAKDYRDASQPVRWSALLDAVETALNAPPPGENGNGREKIAFRALDGAIRAKAMGLRDLEAWRFGQRCAGICATKGGALRYFSIRARLHNSMPTSEGQHDFTSILNHPLFRAIRSDYPDLSSVIEGGPTESPVGLQWLPPQFIDDGRHWTEIPAEARKAFARTQGWEPWHGIDPGRPCPDDLRILQDQIRLAYLHVSIPGVPDSEVYERVMVFCLAIALSAFWAEERWQAHQPTGFLPIAYFFGGAGTGKGTASKIIAGLTTGDTRTYGSQRFDGVPDGWVTESILHLPVMFKDELDQFLPHNQLEDLKSYTSGEPLQLRKKFGQDMTLAPKPVVFSSNTLRINADDEATKDRVLLVQLEANTISTKVQRNQAFSRFFDWLNHQGGCSLLHRVGISLHRDFRQTTIPAPRWTRSSVFDAAVTFVCDRIGANADQIMKAADSGKTTAIVQGAPWFEEIQSYISGELSDEDSYHEAPIARVWSIDTAIDRDRKKFQRWFEQLRSTLSAGPVYACGFLVVVSTTGPKTKRMFHFHKTEAS